jgi:hypothetical protein
MGSLELPKQELRKLVNGDDKKLAMALFSPRIVEAEQEEIKEVLRYVMVKVGLRAQNWPNTLEKEVLIQHIIENFGGNTVQEIRLAFDMAICAKLEIEDVGCYENFSCSYFSKIMLAYRTWAAEAVRQLPTVDPPIQKIFTQDELDDGAREDAEGQYQRFLKGIPLRGVEFNKSILEKDKLLKEGESVYDFFRRNAMEFKQNIYVRK